MQHNKNPSSWNRYTVRCNSAPISSFFGLDPLEAETLAVVATLEAEGDTLETSNLDRLIPSQEEMWARFKARATIAEKVATWRRTVGDQAEVPLEDEDQLPWREQVLLKLAPSRIMEGGSRAWYRLRTGSRRLLRGLWSPTRSMRSTRGGRR